MFKPIAPPERPPAKRTQILFHGRPIPCVEGQSVAAALLAAGVLDFRSTPTSGCKRSPYCMMGVCFECLVVVDGMPNQQACCVEARHGMRIERQSGAPEALPQQAAGAVG